MKRKKGWVKVAKYLDGIYPFVLISVGSMLFGYMLTRITGLYSIFFLILFLAVASFGGSVLDKRIGGN